MLKDDACDFPVPQSDKLPARDRLLILALLTVASWAVVGFCLTLVGV